ncbi:MAG: selenide, water dikinase SelD [Spirochaetia bacterium]|nr:selenide, water dikinase SelD [Spirochaetia bacterium]
MVKTSGCAAKLAPAILDSVLSSLPKMSCDKLVEGFGGNEDALVYDLGEGNALVETVDFFPPMVDDPRTFGRIAAANAISDVYAMGCTPALALNILCIPSCLDSSVMREILLGGQEKVAEAGAVVAGGHTISDPTPKYGVCVSGFGRIASIWRNQGAMIGDVLVLTKKIGTGIIMTASKGEMVEQDSFDAAVSSMQMLNRKASESARDLAVHAATDVTGFSLLGHSLEMAGKGDVTLRIEGNKVPLMPHVLELANFGLLPEGMYNNRDFVLGKVDFNGISQQMQDVLLDPQTSGGLLFSMPVGDAEKLRDRLDGNAWIIGEVLPRGDKLLVVV